MSGGNSWLSPPSVISVHNFHALELAPKAADWRVVAACRKRLVDAQAAVGLAVRSGQPAAEEKVPGLFHASVEGGHVLSSSLMAVCTTRSQVLHERHNKRSLPMYL